jgi:hypothetical protein
MHYEVCLTLLFFIPERTNFCSVITEVFIEVIYCTGFVVALLWDLTSRSLVVW